MLGLGLGSHKASALRSLAAKLLAKLRGRSTYYENNQASKDTIHEIDNYELLDKATILLTPTATSDARVHSVKTYTGDNYIINGGFDTDSNWNKGTGWSISSGVASCDGTQTSMSSVKTTSGLSVQNKLVEVIFDLTRTAGSLTVTLEGTGSNDLSNLDSNGTYSFLATSTDPTPKLIFKANADFIGTVDNVSVIDVSSDFDFDRASSATRINSSGLVQDMQSITDPELVLNGDFEELGDEEVTNGTFDADSDWTKGTGWSIGDGIATSDGGASYLTSSSSFRWTVGKTYKVSLEITEYNSGSVSLPFDAVFGNINYQNSSGVKTAYIVAAANSPIYVYSNNFDGKIDNVSVKQVDPNDRWTLGTGWSIEDGKLVGTSVATQFAQQSFTFINGNTYKITFDITGADTLNDDTSFRLPYDGTGGNISYLEKDSPDGTYSHTFVAGTSSILYLGYIDNGTYTGTIDNISVKDITFSTDVDLARINYDSNGENGHWLLEPTSTNLVPYSENLKDGYSTTNSSVDLDDAVSPDGTTTANKFNSTATASSISKSNANSSALFHTVSIFLKKGTIDIVTLTVTGGSPAISASTTVNLTSGTITASSGNGSITPTITNFGNDWYRITASSTSNGNVANPTISIVNSSTTASGYFYMWGLQFEGLSYATSYIPTYGSTVTRATETLTGSGNSTLINSTEGVLYAEIAALVDDNTNRSIGLSDGTTNNRVNILFGTSSNRIRAMVLSGGATQFDQEYTVTSSLDYHKVAIKYKANDFALWIDGTEQLTDSSGSAPIGLNDLKFDIGNGSLDFYGKCKALAVFNEALSDDELELLTGVTNYGSFGELASANGYTII